MVAVCGNTVNDLILATYWLFYLIFTLDIGHSIPAIVSCPKGMGTRLFQQDTVATLIVLLAIATPHSSVKAWL